MDLPFTLPDWLPAWAFLLLALPALLYLFVFLLMPFSVFGVKARLETLEGQLEAIQDELRNLSARPPGAAPRGRLDEDYDVPNFGLMKSSRARDVVDPLPPAPPVESRERLAPVPRPAPARPKRMEPRLD